MTDGVWTIPWLLTHFGVDVAILLLLMLLYRRRQTAPEMPLVFTALNLGLFAAICAISVGEFPVGIGFGLFGLLSLVRLRSAAFTLKDVAYTFVTLVIALVSGLPSLTWWQALGLNGLLLIGLWIADTTRRRPPTRVMRVTLDRAYGSVEEATIALRQVVRVEPLGVMIDEVDFVRDVTRVLLHHEVTSGWWAEEPVDAF